MGGKKAESPKKVVLRDFKIKVVGELPTGSQPLLDRVKDGVARPDHVPWSDNSVTCEFQIASGETEISTAPFDATGQASLSASATAGTIAALRCNGPHSDATIYSLVVPPSSAVASAPVGIQADQVTEVQISTRTRISIWSTPSRVTAANLSGARGLIDDLSLEGTFSNSVVPDNSTGLPDLTFGWDPTVATLPAKTDDEKKQFFQNIIKVCHKQGVQCLVAFALANNPPADKTLPPANAQARSFQKWIIEVNKLRNPADAAQTAMQAEINKLAGRVVEFVYGSPTSDGNLPDADGITFDIEHVPKGTEISFPDQADVFTRFYTTIAKDDRLVRRRAIVGVAVGQFPASANNRASGTRRQRFDGPTTIGFAKAHPYEMAKGCPNLILRPMAFGDLSGSTAASDLRLWFQDIIDFAIGDVGLHPGQFQLGVRLGGTPGLILTTGDEMKFLLTKILRPNRIGLITFALSDSQNWANYKSVESLLNAGEVSANTVGQPVQVPVAVPVS